jgi:two-component system cell cycle sensor histidine kinase/response regulator CckA
MGHGKDPARAERERGDDAGQLRELRAALEGAQVGLWTWDLRTNKVRFSAEWKRQIGYSNHELTDSFSEWESRVHPDDLERMQRTVRTFLETPWPGYHVEFRFRHRDGSYRWILAQASLTRGEQGQVEQMVGSHIDITNQRCAEEALVEASRALRASEERLRTVTDAVPHMIFQLDAEGRLTYANQRWRDYFGAEARWVMPAARLADIHPDDRALVESQRPRPTGPPTRDIRFDIRCRGQDGAYRWFAGRTVHMRDTDGRLLGSVGTATDIDDLKKSQDALRESQGRLQAALRVGGIGTSVWEIGGRSVWDESLQAMFGRTQEEIDRDSEHRALEYLHRDDRARMRRAEEDALEHGTDLDIECRALRPDGSTFWIAVKGHVEHDAEGRPVRMISAIVDQTSRKRLEAELLQSQKLEAIGRLAGGVAHDFNNLLTVILGHATLLGLNPDLPAWAEESVQDITLAGQRANALTAQLLAFGRRQVMQPRDLDLNDAVSDTLKMLRRVLGRDVVLAFEGCADGVFVRADPNMLTQVLLNLTVNARDAMPGGGRVAVRTSVEVIEPTPGGEVGRLPARRWACLTVSDTGCGIAPDILPHVFEPFFTTKGVGKGTGLGLSTIYGIAKQHGGFVTVDSAPGEGTTFRVFLPPIRPADMTGETREPSVPPNGGVETILLVDDEPAVRSMLVRLLGSHGYEVLPAENGAAALRIWGDRGASIDLLLTDMTMPGGMSGTDLVGVLRGQRPDLKVILSSGKGAEVVGDDLSAQLTFLQKPYIAAHLLRTVRHALDGS